VTDAALQAVAITDLRPTQITLGFREVAQKREQWRKQLRKSPRAFLSRHPVPTVLGPKRRHYLIDKHHLARAMAEEGAQRVMVEVVADLSILSKPSFWIYLDNRSWCHPYDQHGARQDFSAIPKALTQLCDDPFRSLASAVRRAGGFAKNTSPFSEFLWADFLRNRMKLDVVESDFTDAVAEALAVARSNDANCLPGWCGLDPMID
jgi:hypothetical protein